MRKAPDASYRGAFGRLVAIWLAGCSVAFADPCPPPPESLPTAEVRRVIDGDTLVLAGGERVRMVGLDAPELGRDGRRDEPLARDARSHLDTLVDLADRRVLLRHGEESHDRYGRMLAVVYTRRHGDLAARLIEQGLALVAVVPPNIDALECHRAAERTARDAGRGLWALDPGPVTAAAALADTGFAIVHGRAGAWTVRRNDRLLELDGTLVLRFRNADLDRWFGAVDIDAYADAELEVRGWVHPWGGDRRALTVQHPASIGIIRD